jgi:hypothetical protein
VQLRIFQARKESGLALRAWLDSIDDIETTWVYLIKG